MNYLLDTCVLSEFTRRQPEQRVVKWIEQTDEQMLFLSAVTIGEVQRGIERLAESHRKTELRGWLNTGLIERFGPRILTLNTQTLFLWGSMSARLEAGGQPMAVMDGLIAATALQHSLILVTRNVGDFQPCGVQVNNPWE